jgi:hypothetical protein
VSIEVRLYAHEDGYNGRLSPDQAVEQIYGFLASANVTGGDLEIIGAAFATADTITIPPHLAGDIVIIFAWRDGSITPPAVGAGFFTLISGGSNLNANRIGWRTAADSATTSGTWTDATRLICVVVRNAVIDESAADQAGGATDDFYWGSAAFSSSRRALLFGQNNATYSGSAATGLPSTAYRTIASVPDQGSVVHLSAGPVLGPVDVFASLTSTGGTPRYRTGVVPLTVNGGAPPVYGYLARDRLFLPTVEIPSVGDLTGTLAATEAGADTFAGAGFLDSTGTLAATEAGADTFAGTGAVLVSGTLAATEAGADTFAGTGAVLVSGTLAATETGADTFAGTGTVLVSGTLAATETGADTFAATGTVTDPSVTGTLVATETGADTFASTGTVLVSGTLAATEAADTFASTGTVLVSGTLAATETGADTFAGIGFRAATGTLAATEAGLDDFTATGLLGVIGTLAATETGADDFTATGTVLVSGTLAAVEVGLDDFTGVIPDPITGVMVAEERAGGLLFGAKQIRRIYYGATPIV